jgi:hypothetical protein
MKKTSPGTSGFKAGPQPIKYTPKTKLNHPPKAHSKGQRLTNQEDLGKL